MSFTINQRGHLTNWQTSVGDESRSAFQFFGELLDPLVMFDPSDNLVPPLNQEGQCRRSVLDAFAAGLQFDQVVEFLTTEFADQIGSSDEARRFARDMVARYCEHA